MIARWSSRMPALAVYFVRPARIARSAACLMFSGVSKSGSPGPKSHTSEPDARKLSAACIAASVADDCMRATFSETGKDGDITGHVFIVDSTFLSFVFRSMVGRGPRLCRRVETLLLRDVS